MGPPRAWPHTHTLPPRARRDPPGPPTPADFNELYEKRLPDIQKSYFERYSWPKDEEVEGTFRGGASAARARAA